MIIWSNKTDIKQSNKTVSNLCRSVMSIPKGWNVSTCVLLSIGPRASNSHAIVHQHQSICMSTLWLAKSRFGTIIDNIKSPHPKLSEMLYSRKVSNDFYGDQLRWWNLKCTNHWHGNSRSGEEVRQVTNANVLWLLISKVLSSWLATCCGSHW